MPEGIHPDLWGVDASNQFGDPLTHQRTIAFSQFTGTVDAEGKLYRTGGRKRLDYAVTAPAFELKGTAQDMLNAKELIHTDLTDVQEEDALLFKPKNDDFEHMGLKFRMAFLKYSTRMRLLKLVK